MELIETLKEPHCGLKCCHVSNNNHLSIIFALDHPISNEVGHVIHKHHIIVKSTNKKLIRQEAHQPNK